MSHQKKIIKKNLRHMRKEGQLFNRKLILYREEKLIDDLENQMIKGYIEMASINLDIAKIGEVDIADGLKYEAWLSGV